MLRALQLWLHRQGSKLGSHEVRRLENVRQLYPKVSAPIGAQ
jgi:hypothetical protein